MKLILKLIVFLFLTSLLEGAVYSQPESWNQKRAKDEMKQIEEEYNQKGGQIEIDSNSNLQAYLKIAAANNPGLKSAFYDWKAALEEVGYVGVLPDPTITFGHFIENVETRVGPQNQKIGLRQIVPWFGTLGNKEDIAFERSNASYKKFQSEFLRVLYQVKSAYYDYYLLGREIAITKENIALLNFWESIARAKYKVALKQHTDVIKAQLELGKLEDRLLTLEDMQKPIKARLLAALNIPDTVGLPVPSSIEFQEAPASDKDYINSIIQNNPNLDAIKHTIEKEKLAVGLANKSSLPKFTFGLDYIATGEALNPALDESGKDSWLISVGITLPIWFGKNNAKKNEARARHHSAQYLLEDKENQLITLAERVIFEHDDALRKIQLYRDGLVPKAEQSLNAAYTAYQAGKADFLNVLDAQRQLLDFQLMFDRSKTDLAP
jgi:outer membrane protein TolC